jgi:lysyl oxidase
VSTQLSRLRLRTLLIALCIVVSGALVLANWSTHPAGAPRAAAADAGAGAQSANALTPNTLRAAAPNDRLPDLDQETPSELALQTRTVDGHRSYVLGFRSAVVNVGGGPLIVKGSRATRAAPLMRVDQLVEREGAPARVVRHVGRMQYTVSPDHRHWHFLQFDRYLLQRAELRDASGARVLLRDQKTGFCLGDRYRTNQPLRGVAPAQPVFRGRCGLERPDLLHMIEGISVGYGDDYSAFLEGQDLPLDGLPAGRYVLVHRVNVNHALAESAYGNNAASVLLDLRWSAGQPNLRVLATCPDTDRCDHADATFAGARG